MQAFFCCSLKFFARNFSTTRRAREYGDMKGVPAMNWGSFFPALAAAIPAIGAAVLAVWKSYTKLRDEADARKKISASEHARMQEAVRAVLDEHESLKAMLLELSAAQAKESKATTSALRKLARQVEKLGAQDAAAQ